MLKRTLQIFGFAFFFGLALTVAAHAGVNLKKVQVSDADADGSQVELIFDQKLAGNQVKVEYLRDIIQLSLTNVSVYPAKVSTVSSGDLSKVFAYQYSPNLVRCRLTVKGDATQYESRVQVKIVGKTVFLKIAPGTGDAVATAAAAAGRSAEEKSGTKASLNPEERNLLDRVMGNHDDGKADKEKLAKAAKAEKEAADQAAREERAEKVEKAEKEKADKAERLAQEKEEKLGRSRNLTGGKNLPTPMKSIGFMLFTIGLLGGFLMLLKKLKGQKLFKTESKGLTKFLGRLTGGASRGMIEVIATHHLAPKKSIVMVKIQNRVLVLGMTNDAVNLITEFQASEDSGEEVDPVNVQAFAEGLKMFESDRTNGTDQVQAPQSSFAGILTKAFSQSPVPAPASQPKRGPTIAAAASAGPRPSAVAAGYGRGAGALSAGEPTFSESPSLAAAMKGASTTSSLRAQVRSKVEGMKNL